VKAEPKPEKDEPSGLNTRQQRFVEEYCVDYNATRAAIRAGYSEKTAAIIGWENLRKPNISEAIRKRTAELAMTAEEATRRLAEWGRGTLAPFMSVSTHGICIDLASDVAQENIHLIRKLKTTDTRTKDRQGVETHEQKVEIELHDAKDAVIQIAKMHGLYMEKQKDDDDRPDVIIEV